MQLEIAPSGADIVARGIGAVEPQEDESLLHHRLGLKEDAKLGVFVLDGIGRVGQELGVRGDGKDHCRLGCLGSTKTSTCGLT